MRRVLVVATLVLTGCGGGGGGKPPTVQALAAKVGCTGLTIEADNAQRELGAREEGSCKMAADDLTILTYNTNSARDGANRIAKEFGGIAVLGDRWTVRVDTDAAAQRVKAALGGTID